jgi:hypothetical protein
MLKRLAIFSVWIAFLFGWPSVAQERQPQPHADQQIGTAKNQNLPPPESATAKAYASNGNKAVTGDQKTNDPDDFLAQWKKPEWIIVYITAAYTTISLLALIVIYWQVHLMKRQMDIGIARGRAIIQVEAMKIPALIPSDLPEPPYDFVPYKVFNRGLTAARILYAYAIVDIAETSDKCTGQLSTFSKPNFGMNLQSFFPPTSDGVPGYALSEVRFVWQDINNRKKFVHFYGAVKYQDLLCNKGRDTNFHYVWWIDSQRLPDGGVYGHWNTCGDENDNRQT